MAYALLNVAMTAYALLNAACKGDSFRLGKSFNIASIITVRDGKHVRVPDVSIPVAQGTRFTVQAKFLALSTVCLTMQVHPPIDVHGCRFDLVTIDNLNPDNGSPAFISFYTNNFSATAHGVSYATELRDALSRM